MRAKSRFVFVPALLVVTFLSIAQHPSWAAWPQSGLPVCETLADQVHSAITTDGALATKLANGRAEALSPDGRSA